MKRSRCIDSWFCNNHPDTQTRNGHSFHPSTYNLHLKTLLSTLKFYWWFHFYNIKQDLEDTRTLFDATNAKLKPWFDNMSILKIVVMWMVGGMSDKTFVHAISVLIHLQALIFTGLTPKIESSALCSMYDV